ncbi:MAG: hypothetical protein ACLFQV_12805 [Vulcanimicrobiota bacterium]
MDYSEQLKEYGKKIDRLEAEGEKLKAEARLKYHKDLDKLKRKFREANNKFELYKESSVETVEKWKDKMKQIMKDLNDSYEQVKSDYRHMF